MVAVRVLIVLAVGASALFGAAPAQATFPGGNGRIVYVAAGDLVTINPDGTGQVPLTSTGDADHPVWSPDGTRIAFDRTIGGNSDVWVINDDGTGLTQLTNSSSSDLRPTWSPDGGRVAFESTRDGVSQIYSMNADGTDQVRLTNSTDPDFEPDWAPDGSLIVFERVHFGGSLYTINPDGTNPQPLGVNNAVSPGWNSESYRLVFDRVVAPPSGPGRNHVFAVNRDGTHSVDITPTGSSGFSYRQPVWSPNDGRIATQRRLCAFTDPSCTEGSVWRITVFNVDGSNLLEIADGTSPDWQRTPQPRYVRPKGATPFMTYFVPAYHACTNPNRTHGAPLAFPSCAAPNLESLNVTAGTPDANGAGAKFVGSATLKVMLGNPATTTDEADVKSGRVHDRHPLHGHHDRLHRRRAFGLHRVHAPRAPRGPDRHLRAEPAGVEQRRRFDSGSLRYDRGHDSWEHLQHGDHRRQRDPGRRSREQPGDLGARTARDLGRWTGRVACQPRRRHAVRRAGSLHPLAGRAYAEVSDYLGVIDGRPPGH